MVLRGIAAVGAAVVSLAILLLANTVVAEAGPFPDLTIETIELTDKQSIDLPTKEAIHANQVWCATLPDFDEVIICVERSQRIEHFSNKARDQVQGIRSAEPTTVVERKLLDDTIKDLQSDAKPSDRHRYTDTAFKRLRLLRE